MRSVPGTRSGRAVVTEQRVHEPRAPCRYIVLLQDLEHCRMPLPPLVQRHGYRRRDPVCDIVPVIRVDDHSVGELAGGSGEA